LFADTVDLAAQMFNTEPLRQVSAMRNKPDQVAAAPHRPLAEGRPPANPL